MRKESKKIENRPVPLFVIERGMDNFFPKEQFLKNNNRVANWETMLGLFDEYSLKSDYYSEGIFVHSEEKKLPNKVFKKLPYFSERIYTNQRILVIKTYTSVVSVGKSYQVILHVDKHFPKGEKCVIGDNGELVTLLCFKYQIQD